MMKPAVFGAIGAGAVIAALGAVFVLTDGRSERDGDNLAGGPAAASPKAAAVTDTITPMLADAERLLNRGDTPTAKDLYVRARALAKRQNNAAGEAAAVFGLGRLEHFNGQSDAARTAFTEALALYTAAGDNAGRARVEVAYGDLEKDTFRGPQAIQHYRAARAAWALVPEPKSDPHVMLSLDRAWAAPSGEARARAVLDQADKIFHNIGDPEGEGDAAMMLGALEMGLGNPGAAEAAFLRARARYGIANLPIREADALLQVAAAEIREGYNIEAGGRLAEAAPLVRNDSVGAARLAARTGDLERLQGRLAEAGAEYARAAAGLAAANHPDEAAAQLALGQVRAALGEVAAARAALTIARAKAAARGHVQVEAEASLSLGLLVGADSAAALPHLHAALDKFRDAGSALGEARSMLALARLEGQAGESALLLAGDVFGRIGVAWGQVLAALARGDAARAAGQRDLVLAAYREAASIRDGIRKPLSEAGRYLGLPPVESLYYVAAGEVPQDDNPPDPDIVRAAEATRAANLARFANHHAEARVLVAETDARLKAAAAYVQATN